MTDLIHRYGSSRRCDKCDLTFRIEDFVSASGRFNGFCTTCRREFPREAMSHGENEAPQTKPTKRCAKCAQTRSGWSFLGANGAETKWCHECRTRPAKLAHTITRDEYYRRGRRRTA